MDSLIAASARALALGDTLGALKRVALRDDPPALALRGVAMARLGEYPKARELLRCAARGFGRREQLAGARCVAAEAEVALAMRDLAEPPSTLATALAVLESHGDRANAIHARLVAARRELLSGRLTQAAAAIEPVDLSGTPPTIAAVASLVRAELALRSLRTTDAARALQVAHDAARQSEVAELIGEVEEARAALSRPAARLISNGQDCQLRLEEVEALFASGALVVDACRRVLAGAGHWQSLARRPILFTLLRTLAEAWPGDASRDTLIARPFRIRHVDETHRARLRVELGRLRELLRPVAAIEATRRGYALRTTASHDVAVLVPPIEDEQASLIALLSDGAAWSTSALALALGASQRTVQRALVELEAAHRVRSIGQARARRWLCTPLGGFTTILLLRLRCRLHRVHSPRPIQRRFRRRNFISTSTATIVREYGPFEESGRIHGVTHDGRHVWAATGPKIVAIDPASGEIARTIEQQCDAGTAFDGKFIYQIAEARIDKIDPASGKIVKSIPAPGAGADSGMSWAEGSLWVGQYRDRKIHQIDPETGRILRTIESNRFVTGVTWVDGELWHGTWEGDESELRHIDLADGRVIERLTMPEGMVVSGLESDGAGLFYCGGGPSGKVRAVKRPDLG